MIVPGWGIGDLVPDDIKEFFEFWDDPFKAMYTAGREALVDLIGTLMKNVSELTLPDLTLPAFIETYAVSFALSFFVAVLLLIFQLLRVARSRQSVRDFFESVGIYFPLFIGGMMFGPAIGIIIVDFARALSNVMIDFAYSGSVDQMADVLENVFVEDPSLILGGAQTAWALVWGQVFGTVILAVFFIGQMVVLYFSGVLIPLTVVLIVDAGKRGAGTAAIVGWIGILFVHPLLFLLQGLAFRLVITSVSGWGDDGWRNLVNMLVAICAQFLAVLSPFLLIPYIKKMVDGSGNTSSGLGAAAGTAIGAGTLAAAGMRAARNRGGRQTPAPQQQPVRANAIPSATSRKAAAPGLGGRTLAAAGKSAAARQATAGTGVKAGAARLHPAVAVATTAATAGAAVIRKGEENANTSAIKPSIGKDRPA